MFNNETNFKFHLLFKFLINYILLGYYKVTSNNMKQYKLSTPLVMPLVKLLPEL